MKFLPTNPQSSQTEIGKTFEKLGPYIKNLKLIAKKNDYTQNESSINLPFNEGLTREVLSLKEILVSDNLKYVIDIGIGGSNLGTKAIYDALYGYYDNLQPNRYPKIIFLDTNDTHFIHLLKNLLHEHTKNPKEVIVNTISKSGSTAETIANLEIISDAFPEFERRSVITTMKDSMLWKVAESENMYKLSIPKKVGGRYSVFSHVGLFPLACVGVDIVSLLSGAMESRKSALSTIYSKNFSAFSACLLYLNYKKGKNINDNFFFHPELESLGKWYRQLMGESVGKDGKGITPTVSIGSTDLHSMGQLYLGGPKDKFFTFVNAQPTEIENVPEGTPISVLKFLENKSMGEIMDAIYEGVKTTYEKNDLPFVEVLLDNINEKELGAFLQFKMMEMMYLGKLLNVNAFDQPDVESYKSETRSLLEKPH